MCDSRCLTTACGTSYSSSTSFFLRRRRRRHEKNRVLRGAAAMPPARAAPGWSPPRAVLAGRDAPARVRAPRRAPRRAPGACRGRGGPPLGREQSGGGRRPTHSASRSRGSLRGSPTPPISPEAPPREPYPPEAVRRPLRGPLDRTRAVNAHMYSSEPTSVTPLPSLARGNIALQRTEELPGRAKYERCVTPSSRGRTYAKKRQPQRRAWQ